MRLTREQKLEMVLKHLDDGISFAQLAREYQLSTDKVKYFVTLYRMHGEQIFLNQEELAVYTREAKLQAIHRSMLKTWVLSYGVLLLSMLLNLSTRMDTLRRRPMDVLASNGQLALIFLLAFN